MNDAHRRLAEIAANQRGALTTGQTTRWARHAALAKIGAHTYRSPFAGRSELADLHALVLDCGRNAFVSGPTAAALHQFDGFRLKSPYHVTIVRGRNVQRAHHSIHTTTELPQIDRAVVVGLAAMSATRTLVDLSRFVGPLALTAALDSALRDGLTSEDHLHQRIVALRSRGRYGIPKLLAVIEGSEASRGGHSWLERRFLELCRSGRLTKPETQVVLSRAKDRVVRVDCRFPGTPIVVELLGYRWHRSHEQMSRDAERLNALVLDGFRPMQFTYDQVTAEPTWVLDQLRIALATAA